MEYLSSSSRGHSESELLLNGSRDQSALELTPAELEEELEEYLNPSFFRRTLLYPLLMMLMMVWTVSCTQLTFDSFFLEHFSLKNKFFPFSHRVSVFWCASSTSCPWHWVCVISPVRLRSEIEFVSAALWRHTLMVAYPISRSHYFSHYPKRCRKLSEPGDLDNSGRKLILKW